MSYIRVQNFWQFQNADAWKKALQAKKSESKHPNWCKLSVRRDYEMDRLPVPTRLLFLELLRLATTHSNVILNDSEWIAKQISMDTGEVAEGLHQLLEGRWIRVTASKRLSRELLEKSSPKNQNQNQNEESENPPTPLSEEDVENLRRLDEMRQSTLREVV